MLSPLADVGAWIVGVVDRMSEPVTLLAIGVVLIALSVVVRLRPAGTARTAAPVSHATASPLSARRLSTASGTLVAATSQRG